MPLPVQFLAQRVVDFAQIGKHTFIICLYAVGQKCVVPDILSLRFTDEACNNIDQPFRLSLFNKLRRIDALCQKPNIKQVEASIANIKAFFVFVIDNGFLVLILCQTLLRFIDGNFIFHNQHCLVDFFNVLVNAAPLCVNPTFLLQIAHNVLCGNNVALVRFPQEVLQHKECFQLLVFLSPMSALEYLKAVFIDFPCHAPHLPFVFCLS